MQVGLYGRSGSYSRAAVAAPPSFDFCHSALSSVRMLTP
jgi:hypothetical protein